jgi:SRSO17 transposase
VYTWDGHSPHYNERTLLIRITRHSDDEIQVKYAITNAKPQDVSLQELTQMQAQRSYIERAFQECKQDIGMSEYQVRGWLAWHHHMALCIMHGTGLHSGRKAIAQARVSYAECL